MTATELIVADIQDDQHRAHLLALNLEYVSWVFSGVGHLFQLASDEIVGMPVHEYVASAVDKICGLSPPQGIFYLLKVDGEVCGMGGFRALAHGSAELKRLYVRPSFRGRGLGDLLLHRLLAEARKFGYRTACLDTALFMHSAHRLYERHGFADCAVYEGSEVPAAFRARWRFMARAL